MLKIPEQEYKKAIGQWKLQAGTVLSVFNMHGMDVYIPGALEELQQITERFGERVRGKDVPIIVKKRRRNDGY